MKAVHVSLQIKKRGDIWDIVGAVDMGQVCQDLAIISKQKKQVKLATHVLQFVFNGYTGFRWPVAYYATATASAHDLYILVWEVIKAVDDAGFNVGYVLMDGASTNRSLLKMILGPEAPRPSLTSHSPVSTRNVWVCTEKIVFSQDIMHCFKKIRNGVASSRLSHEKDKGRHLILGGNPVVWDHWEEAFAFNNQGGFRIHRKLTKEHIELSSTSKMRNHLATQVLDKDMLYLMKQFQLSLPEGSRQRLDSSIAFLENVSVLVDIFKDTRALDSLDDDRLVKIRTSLEFFNSWEKSVESSKDGKAAKNLLTQETRDDLNLSVLGFIEVAKAVIAGGHSIVPCYLNSDLVENFFCQQRGIKHGCNTNPNVLQYGPAVNAIILGQMAVSRKSNADSRTLYMKATSYKPLTKSRARKRPSSCTSSTFKKLRL